MGSGIKVTFLLLVTFAIIIPCLNAGIAELDDYLKRQAEQAHKLALETFVPDPEEITTDINVNVHRALREYEEELANTTVTTRRALGQKKAKGPCEATNPIDRCWRCRSDWAEDRFRLATCSRGFGRKATGGAGGRIYIVTDPSDDDMVSPKPGTLRHAAIQQGPIWIIFERSMKIVLNQELMVTSDTTIDGRGANVQIKGGAGITMQFVNNVIIHNLRISKIVSKMGGMIRDNADHIGFRTRSDGDAISVYQSTNIWIDHISLSDSEDGLVDVIQGSTGITISNCHLTKHNDVMLLGASDAFSEDKIMQVTVAFNHFGQGLIQRMPRVRWGFVHVVNNDYTHWLMYAIGGSSGPTVLSQGNRFIAPPNEAAKEITHRDYASPDVWRNWQWTSDQDHYMNGATFCQTGVPVKNLPYKKQFIMKPKPGIYANRLTKHSGALQCIVGRPC